MSIANRRSIRPVSSQSESEDEPVAVAGGGGGVGRHVPGVVVPEVGNGGGSTKMTTTEENRSDTESPVGPVKTNNSNPGHSYVNLLHNNGQEVHSDNETPPPLVAKKERSRYSAASASTNNNFYGQALSATSAVNNRKSRSRERPSIQKQNINGNGNISHLMNINGNISHLTEKQNKSSSVDGEDCSAQQQIIKDRERELERIHRRSRELMLSPRLMDCSGGLSSRDSSMDRSQRSQRNCVSPPSRASPAGWKPSHQQQQPPPLPPRISSPPNSNGTSNGSSRYKSPSPSRIQPAMSHQRQSYLPRHHHHHNTGNMQQQQDTLRRRVQSPRRRDYKDFSAAPAQRDFRSPLRYHNGNAEPFILPGYALSPDEDEDSGADSLNEHLGNIEGSSTNGSQSFGVPHCSVPSCMHCYHGNQIQNQSQALVPYGRDSHHGCCNGGGRGHDCCWSSPHQRASLQYESGGCWHSHSQSTSRALSPIQMTDEKLRELETDKESLRLQVVVLSDQVDTQCEKIGDLEKLLDDKKEVLRRTEDILQREMINRSALETKKLELMSDLASLKLRQAAIEKENMELRKKLAKTLHQLQIPPSSSDLQSTSTIPSNNCVHATLPKRLSVNKEPLETHFNVKDNQKDPTKLKNNHSGSAPNLASNNGYPMKTNASPTTVVPEKSKSSKGFRKIFGKMRRSSSGNLQDEKRPDRTSTTPKNLGSLQGYARTSEGSRLSTWIGSTTSSTSNNIGPNHGGNHFKEPNIPFRDWDLESVCAWMEHLLGHQSYAVEVGKLCKNSSQLLDMSLNDLDIKLGIKNNLHRKKLFLALRAKNPECQGPEKFIMNLESHWIVSWLDDIGLPQYKERFLEAKIDVRVLNFITTEDLCQIKITNLLHHLSMKRGIQILRQCSFDPSCLKRRSPPIPDLTNQVSSPTPEQVALWTNNRVMEWLRSANLAEYAPNLRGSGVHGSLLIYEPMFTSDLLAALLSIPPNKTLLRRHLNLHFGELVGKNVMQTKRDVETIPNYQPLTATAKVKISKKSQFTLTRRSRSSNNNKSNSNSKSCEIDFEDLVCPLDIPSNVQLNTL